MKQLVHIVFVFVPAVLLTSCEDDPILEDGPSGIGGGSYGRMELAEPKNACKTSSEEVFHSAGVRDSACRDQEDQNLNPEYF